jgi:hypothetical protein
MKFGRPYQAIYRERMGDGILSLHICGKTNDIIEGMATTGCEMLELDHQIPSKWAAASPSKTKTGRTGCCLCLSYDQLGGHLRPMVVEQVPVIFSVANLKTRDFAVARIPRRDKLRSVIAFHFIVLHDLALAQILAQLQGSHGCELVSN